MLNFIPLQSFHLLNTTVLINAIIFVLAEQEHDVAYFLECTHTNRFMGIQNKKRFKAGRCVDTSFLRVYPRIVNLSSGRLY